VQRRGASAVRAARGFGKGHSNGRARVDFPYIYDGADFTLHPERREGVTKKLQEG
jgi:hypothetical protein